MRWGPSTSASPCPATNPRRSTRACPATGCSSGSSPRSRCSTWPGCACSACPAPESSEARAGRRRRGTPRGRTGLRGGAAARRRARRRGGGDAARSVGSGGAALGAPRAVARDAAVPRTPGPVGAGGGRAGSGGGGSVRLFLASRRRGRVPEAGTGPGGVDRGRLGRELAGGAGGRRGRRPRAGRLRGRSEAGPPPSHGGPSQGARGRRGGARRPRVGRGGGGLHLQRDRALREPVVA